MWRLTVAEMHVLADSLVEDNEEDNCQDTECEAPVHVGRMEAVVRAVKRGDINVRKQSLQTQFYTTAQSNRAPPRGRTVGEEKRSTIGSAERVSLSEATNYISEK